MDRLFDMSEAADRMNTSIGTLRFWRHKGIGPRSARIGRRVMYRESDLQAWLDEQFAHAVVGDDLPSAAGQ